jgi:hypothetical protein
MFLQVPAELTDMDLCLEVVFSDSH